MTQARASPGTARATTRRATFGTKRPTSHENTSQPAIRARTRSRVCPLEKVAFTTSGLSRPNTASGTRMNSSRSPSDLASARPPEPPVPLPAQPRPPALLLPASELQSVRFLLFNAMSVPSLGGRCRYGSRRQRISPYNM